MSDKQTPEAFYKGLKEKLKTVSTWPGDYLFKFIVPSGRERIMIIEDIFEGYDAEITTKDSSKGNYTSVSVRVKMDSPDAVIVQYKAVGERVKDVISL